MTLHDGKLLHIGSNTFASVNTILFQLIELLGKKNTFFRHLEETLEEKDESEISVEILVPALGAVQGQVPMLEWSKNGKDLGSELNYVIRPICYLLGKSRRRRKKTELSSKRVTERDGQNIGLSFRNSRKSLQLFHPLSHSLLKGFFLIMVLSFSFRPSSLSFFGSFPPRFTQPLIDFYLRQHDERSRVVSVLLLLLCLLLRHFFCHSGYGHSACLTCPL